MMSFIARFCVNCIAVLLAHAATSAPGRRNQHSPGHQTQDGKDGTEESRRCAGKSSDVLFVVFPSFSL